VSDAQLDARRLLCPLPVIRAQEKVEQLVAGDTLTVYCTDPGAMHDIPAWCRVHGHEILSIEQDSDEIRISIKVCDVR